MGLVSQLSAEMCSYFMNFYTSSWVNNTSKAFEANRRVVLAMRNIGDGHQGLVKFCGVMNMLAPMNANPDHDLCPKLVGVGIREICPRILKNTHTVTLYQKHCHILYCQHL